MFTRFKQRLKEKTGRAQATRLPAEIETELRYLETYRKALVQLKKAAGTFVDCWHPGKIRGTSPRDRLNQNLANLVVQFSNREEGKAWIAALEHSKARGKAEYTIYEKVVKGFSIQLRKFEKEEAKEIEACTKMVERRRLEMDSAVSTNDRSRRENSHARDYSKQTEESEVSMNAATEQYNAALDELRQKIAQIPAWEERHLNELRGLCGALAGK